jgi:hypothetical protein
MQVREKDGSNEEYTFWNTSVAEMRGAPHCFFGGACSLAASPAAFSAAIVFPRSLSRAFRVLHKFLLQKGVSLQNGEIEIAESSGASVGCCKARGFGGVCGWLVLRIPTST